MNPCKAQVEWNGAAIESSVRKFMMENFLVEETDSLKDTDSLLEKGIMDSTGVLELVAFIEKQFDIEIEDDELIPENLDSIENIRKFITIKMNQGESQAGGLKTDVA